MKKKDNPKLSSDLPQEDVVKKTIEETLRALQVDGEISLSMHEEVIDVVLDTKDSGIVIGYHGEVLESVQVVLSAIVSKKIGKFIRVSLEIGEYKKNRTDWLENLASQTKEKALSEQQEVSLPGLKSWERRIVHLLLQDDKEVSTESIGEGRDRTLVIKPR